MDKDFYNSKKQSKNSGYSGHSGYSGNSGLSENSGYSGKPKPNVRHYADGTASVLRKPVVYTELRFFQRSNVLYQLTKHFCQRYFPSYGDHTVDQMVMAARSTKQNIAEGSSDSQTSSKSELTLLGVARGSNIELLEDYKDYLKHKGLKEWYGNNPRFERGAPRRSRTAASTARGNQ